MGESSKTIRTRVQTARNIQLKCFSTIGSSDIVFNADMRIGEIRQFCKQPEEDYSLMRAAMTQLNLSARGYHRVLKLVRKIVRDADVVILLASKDHGFAYSAFTPRA